MEYTLFYRRFRLILIVGTLTSFLGLVISFLPYEVLSPILNGFAGDGSLDMFSQDIWVGVSRILGYLMVGLFMFFFFVFLIRARIGPFVFARVSGFFVFLRRFRHDVQVLVKDSYIYIWKTDQKLIILSLTIMALVPRLANLFIDLEFDEAYLYNAFASHSFWNVITDYHVPNNHVLYTIIVHFLTRYFGNHLWLMRIPSLIAGVLMAPVGYLVAKRLYGSGAGIFAGIFISFFPILVKFSVLVRGYIFISLFTLLIILIADYVRVNKNRGAWVALAFLSALGLYTVPLMLFPMSSVYLWLFMSMVVGDVLSYESKYDFFWFILWSGGLAVLLALLFYSPIIYFESHRLFDNKFIAPVALERYPSVMYARLKETWNIWMSMVPVWIVDVGVVGLITSIVFHKKMASYKVSFQMAFVIWVLGYCLYRRPEMESRMWVYVAAPLLIWASGGVDYLLGVCLSVFNDRLRLKKWVNNGLLVIAVVFSVMMIPSIPERWSQIGSVEATVLYLKDNLKEGDMVSASKSFRPMLQYYFKLYDVSRDWYSTPKTLSRAFVLVRSVNGSPEMGDTLDAIAPKDEKGILLVDLSSARVVHQYDDLAIYEVYSFP